MYNVSIELLSKDNSQDIYFFEQENKVYFERTLPPRPDGYYDLESFDSIIDELISEQNENKCYMYIIRNSDNIMVGRVNLFIIENELDTAELGYRIAEKENGKGYATMAIALVLEKAFNLYGLEKVIAGTAKENKASQNVLSKNGFYFTKEIKKDICLNDKWVDTLVFKLSKEDYCGYITKNKKAHRSSY